MVNTASYCGFTHQYEGLEALYAKYNPKGLVVLGFPSNDFGKQEPGSSKEIADFCYNTYGVKFPMFSKSSVIGANANPLHVALAKATGKMPKWNFHKYLIDRNGKIVGSYSSWTEPNDKTLVADISAPEESEKLPQSLGEPLFDLPLSGWYWQTTRLNAAKPEVKSSLRCTYSAVSSGVPANARPSSAIASNSGGRECRWPNPMREER